MKASVLLSFWLCSGALALQEYCKTGFKPIAEKPFALDLYKLKQDFVVYKNESTFPSIKSVVTQINICDALSIPKEEEQITECLQGTYACQRVIYNQKKVDYVAEIHNIAGDYEKSKLDPEFKVLDPSKDSKASGYQYSLVLSGENEQSAIITLECDQEQSREKKASEPTIVSYHNNVLTFYWKTVFACAYDEGEKQPDNGDHDGNDEKKEKEGKTAVGILFTVIFVLLAVYFVGGAIYNMKVYNARGLDLIPHRDFWLDLPYLIKDLIAHAFDTIMSRRRGGGGYVAV